MLAMASSSGVGTGVSSRMARENRSPWMVNWSQTASSWVCFPFAVVTLSTVGRSVGGLKGISISSLPSVPRMLTCWKSESCVATVNVALPGANSRMPLAMRSVLKRGSRSSECESAEWLAGKDQAREGYGVAAHIQQAAPTDIRHVAHVAGIIEEIVEGGVDGAHLPQRPALHNLLRQLPLRVVAVHEGFHHLQLRMPFCRIQQAARIRRVQPERFLAQHMLAGFQRLERPGHVQVVGQRVVDGFDSGVSQQLLIGSVGFGDAKLLRGSLRFFQAARGNGGHLAVLPFLHGGQDFAHSDVGGADHTPVDFSHHPPRNNIATLLPPVSLSLRGLH